MNKQMTAADAVAHLRDGMTIGFGGWGWRRSTCWHHWRWWFPS